MLKLTKNASNVRPQIFNQGDSYEGRLVEVIASHQLEGTLSVVGGRGQQEESQKTLLRGLGNPKGMCEEIILDLIFQVEDFVHPNGKISLQREETPSNR